MGGLSWVLVLASWVGLGWVKKLDPRSSLLRHALQALICSHRTVHDESIVLSAGGGTCNVSLFCIVSGANDANNT